MRVGLSTYAKDICEDLFKEYQQANITDMEISVGYEKYKELNYKEVYAWAKRYKVNLWSYHLPFESPKIDISNKLLMTYSIELFSELIKKGSDIGIDKFVLHPSSEPINDYERRERMECAKESLSKLAQIAKQCGAVIAVEDLPRTCLGRNSEELLELVSVHTSLGVCFDTNHLLNEDILTFIRNVGERIITLHVSDYDFINERHWLPGEGDVDWQAVIATLNEIGYNGPWLYEIALEAPATIERRQLELDDFFNNATALFKGEMPIAIGKRKENLGMWG